MSLIDEIGNLYIYQKTEKEVKRERNILNKKKSKLLKNRENELNKY